MDDMHFGDGNPADYPRESLNNYYDRASYGLLDLSNGSTLGWYQTAYNRPAAPATKAGWGAARRALISEALNTFDATHDFSQYDNNGDGVIDYFIVYWTGPTGDWATYWWAWNTYYGDNTYTLDGVSLNNYSWQPETDFPATTLHETGHSLGLPDLYEYGGATLHGGVGNFDIMDGNVADLNCFWKWMLDWYTPTVVDASRQRLTLNDTESQDCVLIWPGVSTDDLFSEFFIVQNRQTTGNDEDVWFSPDGLPIWHIDATLNAAGNNFEYDNSFTAHKLVRLMEADGLEEIESGGSADIGDLYSVGDTIGPDTSPSSDRYDGTDSCVRVWNVVDDGTAPGDTMTADYSTICNTPPVCNVNGPYVVECKGATTSLPLNGAGTYDPDGDPMTYDWSSDCPGGVFDDYTALSPQITINTPDTNIPVSCTVEMTVTDTADDIDTASASLTVVDTTPPDIVCPADVTIECDQSSDPGNTGIATATDECSPSLAISFTDLITPGTCPAEETIARTWMATDTAGNQSSCLQIIDVVDTTAPVITCNNPATITPKDPPVSFTATAVDNCDDDPLVEITGYTCTFTTKKGNVINKDQSCIVAFAGDTLTIDDSGGIDDHISWTVQATDCTGNQIIQECSTDVVKYKKP
jgi:M6 family metalloprotease-like protein